MNYAIHLIFFLLNHKYITQIITHLYLNCINITMTFECELPLSLDNKYCLQVAIDVKKDEPYVNNIYWPLVTIRQILGCSSLVDVAREQKYKCKRIYGRRENTYTCTKDDLFECIDIQIKEGTIADVAKADIIKSHIERCNDLLKKEVELWLKQGKGSPPQNTEPLDNDLDKLIQQKYCAIEQNTIQRYKQAIETRSPTSKQKRRSSPSPTNSPETPLKRGRECDRGGASDYITQPMSNEANRPIQKRRILYENEEASDDELEVDILNVPQQRSNTPNVTALRKVNREGSTTQQSKNEPASIDFKLIQTSIKDFPTVQEVFGVQNEYLQTIIDEKNQEFIKISHLVNQAEELKKILDGHIQMLNKQLKNISSYVERLEDIEKDHFRIRFVH